MAGTIPAPGAADFELGGHDPLIVAADAKLDATLEEAIERANGVRFGLSTAVFTTSLATATRCVDALQTGIIHVNSGYGPHEQSRAAFQFYTEEVTVYQDA
jgi:acyl-CoA reductase-like NAD-dependent aldehyde dehydrogenase